MEHKTNSIAMERSVSLKPVMFGLIIQFVFFTFHIIVGIWTKCQPLEINSYFLLLCTGFWGLALIHTQLRKKSNEEKNELIRVENLRKERGAKSALFQNNELSSGSFLQNLIRFEKYFLPVICFIFAIVIMTLGYSYYQEFTSPFSEMQPRLENIFKASAFIACISFLLLVSGLYLRALAKGEYSYMRGPATIMLTCSALCLAEAASLIAFTTGGVKDLLFLFLIGAILTFSVGFELLLNTFLYLFKPVHKEEIHLPPYDSRVFLLLTSTGSAWKSLNGMIDYQFGFRISESWFYKTILKLVLPFILLQILVGMLCTSFVMIPSGQLGVIERFGQPMNNGVGLEPGLHFKLPWPIDEVIKVDVSRVFTIEAGHKNDDHNSIDPAKKNTLDHYRETDLFVVKKKSGNENEDHLELVSISAVFQYQANSKKLIEYLYRVESIENMIQMMVHSELSSFLAEKTITSDMGNQISVWNEEFKSRFFKRVEMELPGISPIYLSLNNIHVPVELSESVNEIFIASEKKKISVYQAQADAIKLETQALQEVLEIQNDQKQAIFKTAMEAIEETKRINNLKEIDKSFGRTLRQREWLEILEKALGLADIDFVPNKIKINLEDGNKGHDPLEVFKE